MPIPSISNLTPEQQRILTSARILFPAPLPPENNIPHRQNIEKWVAVHQQFDNEPVLAHIAGKIGANINYIPFAAFLNQLSITINDFLKNFTPSEPFIICLPHKKQFKSKIKSQHWLIGIALQFTDLPFPTAILETQDIPSFLEKNSNVRSILYLDDAGYSGSQLSEALIQLRKKLREKWQQTKLYLCIPFQTHEMEIRFRKDLVDTNNIINLKSTILPTLDEILNAEEAKYLMQEISTLIGLSLTYFDHVFPDHYSTLFHLQDGNLLMPSYKYLSLCGYDVSIHDTDGGWTLAKSLMPPVYPLVPKIVRPYRYYGQQPQTKIPIESSREANSIDCQYGTRFDFFKIIRKSATANYPDLGIKMTP